MSCIARCAARSWVSDRCGSTTTCTAPVSPTWRRWKRGLWRPRCSAAPSVSASDIWCCAISFVTPRCWPRWRPPLDQVSAGRLDLGIGSGSIEDEHHRLGLDWGTFAGRSERLAETLEMLTQAFDNEVIDFAGSHYTVRDMPIVPGPVQRPRPPITVGGVGRKVHVALGCAICRRLECAHLRARRARAQGVGAAVRLRGHRPRSRHHRAVGRSRHSPGPRRHGVTEGPQDR